MCTYEILMQQSLLTDWVDSVCVSQLPSCSSTRLCSAFSRSSSSSSSLVSFVLCCWVGVWLALYLMDNYWQMFIVTVSVVGVILAEWDSDSC